MTRCNSRDCRPDELLLTSDRGETWRVVTPPLRMLEPYLGDLEFLDARHGWVVAGPCETDTVVLRTTDGGRTWRASHVPSPTCHAGSYLDLKFLDSRNGWMVHQELLSESATLSWTSDGGATWSTPKKLPAAGRVNFQTRNDGWARTDFFYTGDAYVTSDGGRTWRHRALPVPVGLDPIGHLSSRDPPALFEDGTGILTELFERNGEFTLAFYAVASGTAPILAATLPVGPDTRRGRPAVTQSVARPDVWWVLTDYPATLHFTTDAGETWEQRPAPAFGQLFAVDSRTAWLAGDGLFETSDGGRSWRRVRPPV